MHLGSLSTPQDRFKHASTLVSIHKRLKTSMSSSLLSASIYLSIYASKSFSVMWSSVVLAVQIDVVCTYSSFAKHFALHWQHSHWQQNTAIHMSCRGRDYFVERGLRLELQEMKFQYYEKERKGMRWMSISFIMCCFFHLDLAFAEDLDTHLKSVCNVDVKFWGCWTDSLAY